MVSRRVLPLVLAALVAGCVGNTFGEDRISGLLAGRKVQFGTASESTPEPFWQSWAADGTTATGGSSFLNRKSGRWRVENGTYCEIFGKASGWTCWRITLSDGGQTIRFWEIPGDMGDLLIFHRDLTGRFVD